MASGVDLFNCLGRACCALPLPQIIIFPIIAIHIMCPQKNVYTDSLLQCPHVGLWLFLCMCGLLKKNIIYCFERLIMARLCWKYAAWKWAALSLLFCLMRVSVLVLVKERWASGVAFVLMRPVLGASGVEDPSAYAVCGWSYVCSRSIIVVARQSYFFVWFCRFYRIFEWENAESILSFILVSLSSIKRNVSPSRLDLKGKD